jgi:hypothetical protein
MLIRLAGKAAAKRFDIATADPAASQQNKLMEIMRRNEDTEYGKKYGFASVKNLADFQARVPIVTYEDIKPYMDRIVRGEKNVLVVEDPTMFAQTSGTTGNAKYIPVTPTCQGRDHSDQMRTWIYKASQKHPGMFKGKVISMVSPAVEGHTESGLPYGSTSGHIYSNMPSVVRSTYAIPYDVFLIEDYDAKYYTLMRIGVAENISFVATANPSSIIKMCEFADRFADEIIADIAAGTLKADLKIEPRLRSKIEHDLKAKPARARELEGLRQRRNGRLLPGDYWPDLALIGCWKGGTVGTYVERFPEWFDPDKKGMVPTRDWGFLASEARGSIPLTDHGSAGVLTVSTNVFEFVLASELEDNQGEPDKWTFLGVESIEENQEYYIFVTTTGGLYRYDINDVIEVMGRYQNTPTIVFKRKGRGMANITGEKLSVNQLIDAFNTVGQDLTVVVNHFKAEPDYDKSRYVFKVESDSLTEDKRLALLQGVDNRLSELNIEYQAKRKSGRLAAPVMHVMKLGWYERQKKELAAEGKRVFQAKTVLLDAKQPFAEDAENLEAVVEFQA